MHEPFEQKLERKMEAKLGPALEKWGSLTESKIRIRFLAIFICIITTIWWACRLLHSQLLRSGFLETACLDIIVVGPFAVMVLLVALLISAVRAGWPDRAWILSAVICALSPWPVVLSVGFVRGTGLDAG
jgi:hypothetical protein